MHKMEGEFLARRGALPATEKVVVDNNAARQEAMARARNLGPRNDDRDDRRRHV